MFKKEIFILLILVIFSAHCSAELVDGPANIRSEPNGKIIFSINNDVDIDVGYKFVNDWVDVGVPVYVNTKDLINFDENIEGTNGATKIKQGSILYDYNGEKIGKAISEVNIEVESTYDKKTKKFYAYLWGYTYRSNIKWGTAIERDFEKLIDNSNNLDMQYYVRNVKGYYEWNKVKTEKGVFEGFIYSEAIVTDPSPGYRIALVFFNKELVAILHSRPIHFKKYQDKSGYDNYIIINNKLGKDLDEYCKHIWMYSGQ